MILLRMISWDMRFEHLQARVLFGMNDLVLSWMEEAPMPETLPDDIAAALQMDAIPELPEPEPEPELEPEPETPL